MFEQLLNLIIKGWDKLTFVTFLYDYEIGIIYRFGAYHRKMNVGINFKIPLIEDYKQVSRQDDTKQLKTQTLTVSDGVYRTVIPCVCFYVHNAQKYFKNVLSAEDSIVEDLVAGIVAKAILSNVDLNSNDVLKDVRDACNTYGYKVRDLTFVTDANIPAQRIILDKDIEIG